MIKLNNQKIKVIQINYKYSINNQQLKILKVKSTKVPQRSTNKALLNQICYNRKWQKNKVKF